MAETIEKWEWIHGYELRYQVSDRGRVRSFYRDWYRKIKYKTPRLLKPQLRGSRIKYPSVTFTGTSRELVNMPIHRLVLETFSGLQTQDMECCHIDGNPLNSRIENLKWGTAKENQFMRYEHGTAMLGSKNHATKLSAPKVLRIRKMIAQGISYKEIGLAFGVSAQAIFAIKTGKNWKHVK